MIVLARIVLRLLADLAGLVVLSLRPRRSVEAENLFLRRELALYQERVAPSRLAPVSELLLKLGLRVSPRPVRKYMPKRPPGRPRGDQRWASFLRNHARAIVACDFFVAVTATFQLLYVFVVIDHARRRLRTRDRNDSTRVPGLVDTAIGVAPAIDPEGMGGSLQPRTPAHGARSRRAGPFIGRCAVCDTTNPPSDRRAPRSARQIGAGRLASRISAGARVGVIG